MNIDSSSADALGNLLRRGAEPTSGPAVLQQTVDPSITQSVRPWAVKLDMLSDSRYGLGSRFDAVVDRSPLLQSGLEQLRADGYKIELGSTTYIDRSMKTVSIAFTDLYKVQFLAQSLSHELGHLTNEERYLDYRSKDA